MRQEKPNKPWSGLFLFIYFSVQWTDLVSVGATFFPLLPLLILTCFKWPLNTNDYLYRGRVCGADDSQVLEIATPFFSVRRLSLSLSLTSSLSCRTIIEEDLLVTSGSGCVGGRTRWLKVCKATKDSFFLLLLLKETFHKSSLLSDSRFIWESGDGSVEGGTETSWSVRLALFFSPWHK